MSYWRTDRPTDPLQVVAAHCTPTTCLLY